MENCSAGLRQSDGGGELVLSIISIIGGETLFAETNQKMEHLLWTAYRTLDEKKKMLKNIIEDENKLLQEQQKIDIQLTVLEQLRQNVELDEDTK